MKIVVLHNQPSADAGSDEQDVLLQRDYLVAALQRLGHETPCLGCTLDLETVYRELRQLRPEITFNLVESLGGTDRLMPLATLLLDALALPYTGASTNAILATSNKLAAKQRLYAAELPTPAWMVDCRHGNDAVIQGQDIDGARFGKWIIKPVWEHASVGMEDDAVVAAGDYAAIQSRLDGLEPRGGLEQSPCRPHFAEQYIEGREFNLSLLAGHVLPPAEIDFSAFPPEKPRIVGYQAKWQPTSFEYQQTPRRFDFPSTDALLLEELAELAHECWQLFELQGYARVDFRVDRAGRPWILEVNANPCLAPDAGFAAALTQAGIPYDDAVRQIIDEVNRCSTLRVENIQSPAVPAPSRPTRRE